LRPIWTIMVAAKLDQSRVLVTKFRQNRLMLKGRSAGQRHRDRQIHRQTDRQPRLKIRALQVRNRAKNNQSGEHLCRHTVISQLCFSPTLIQLIELRFYISLGTKISHFEDALPSQSLGIVLKKLNLTQQKHTYTNKL